MQPLEARAARLDRGDHAGVPAALDRDEVADHREIGVGALLLQAPAHAALEITARGADPEETRRRAKHAALEQVGQTREL